MKIGILFNCQHEGLGIALRALRPRDDIVDFSLESLDEAARARVAAVLAGCDHVVSIDVAQGYGPLATDILRRNVRRLHVLPYFRFAGFHPDTVSITVGDVALDGPTGAYHSRIAVAGLLAGLSPRATADLYNRLSFARLGYFEVFAEQHALLLERYAAYRIDFSSALPRWLAPGCFMHSVNHPRMRVMLDMAQAVCGLAGLAPQALPPSETSLRDNLAAHPTHPVFPDIAAALDIPPSGAFRAAVPPSGIVPRVMSTEAFVTGAHAALQRAPLAALRQVDGVAAAMAALGLSEVARPRAPRQAVPPPGSPQQAASADAAALLTFHGGVLAIETASAMLMQIPAAAADGDHTDLIVMIPSLPVTAAATSPMMGGVAIAPARRPGSVSLRRGQKYLHAGARQSVLFNQDDVTNEGMLLPVRLGDLQTLRTLLRGAWVAHTGLRLPLAANRMLNDFTLALGPCAHRSVPRYAAPGGGRRWRAPLRSHAGWCHPAALARRGAGMAGDIAAGHAGSDAAGLYRIERGIPAGAGRPAETAGRAGVVAPAAGWPGRRPGVAAREIFRPRGARRHRPAQLRCDAAPETQCYPAAGPLGGRRVC